MVDAAFLKKEYLIKYTIITVCPRIASKWGQTSNTSAPAVRCVSPLLCEDIVSLMSRKVKVVNYTYIMRHYGDKSTPIT